MSTPALHPAVLATLLRTTLDALPINPNATEQEKAAQREAILVEIQDLAPANPAQARLAARIVTAHYVTMECLRRAAQPGLPDGIVLRFQGKAVALNRMGITALRDLLKLQAAEPARPAAPPPAVQAAQPRPTQPQPQPQPARPQLARPHLARKDPMQREKPGKPAPMPTLSPEDEALLQRAMHDLLGGSSVSMAALTAGLLEIPDAA